MRFSLSSLLLISAFTCGLPGGILAQQQTPYVVGSTVSGRVICGDTNAPARFAKVLLKSTAPDHAGEDFLKSFQDNLAKAAAKEGAAAAPPKPMTDEQQRALAAATKGMNQATDMLNASTVGLDGAYSFSGIKPGTYYVHAIFAGYIDPYSQFSDDDFASTDPAIKARIAQIPTITVTGKDAAHIDLRLERGGAVSGRILFDDGSPAAGWTLTAVAPKGPEEPADATAAMMSQALSLSGGVQIFKTDDLGRYRISGLAAGDYALRATLVASAIGVSASNIGDGGSGISLAVYTGDTFRRADAKPVHVTAGEERSGVDITVPAHSLHNIVGHVVAKEDGHTLNVGSVSLTTKENPALHLKAAVRDDGSFHFDYLPGKTTYTVSIEDGADGKSTDSPVNFLGISVPHPEILRKYGPDTAEVALGDADVDSVKLTVAKTDWVPPAKKANGGRQADPGDMFNGLLPRDDE